MVIYDNGFCVYLCRWLCFNLLWACIVQAKCGLIEIQLLKRHLISSTLWITENKQDKMNLVIC